MSDKQAGQQAVSGNTDVTYETIDTEDPVTPKTDNSGITITGDNVFSGVTSGTDTIGSAGTNLNGGTSLTVPKGSAVSVQNRPSNSGKIRIDGVFTLSPGESMTIPVNDVSKISVDPVSGSPVVEWMVTK